MVKRNYIAGVLLAAFLAWQVHSLVPHHHHGQEICFDTGHCHESQCTPGISPDNFAHQHDNPHDEDGCILRQVSFLPSSGSKITVLPVPCKNWKSDFMVLMIPDLENPGPGALTDCCTIPGFSLHFIPRSLKTSSALRAPPRA